MVIAVANDHAGTEFKFEIVKHLQSKGYTVLNLGTDGSDSVDYPDYAKLVADAINGGKADCGVLICGTGVGMSIAANKIDGIRASLCGDCFSAEMTRRHNDSNVLCLGARVIGIELAKRVVDSYFSASFEGGRHIARLEKIKRLEQNR